MDDKARMRGNEIGPTGKTVAGNVKRLRMALGIGQAELSKRLAAVDRPIPVSSIGKIEMGLRKVEVDDLAALAMALDVSPLALLLPDTRRGAQLIEVANRSIEAGVIWDWAAGRHSLEPSADQEFQSRSMPPWFSMEWFDEDRAADLADGYYRGQETL